MRLWHTHGAAGKDSNTQPDHSLDRYMSWLFAWTSYCCCAAAYMTLPASQYSVLDAKQIERIDDSTFRCYVGGLRFLGFTIDPVLTVSVDVTEKGPTVATPLHKGERLADDALICNPGCF